MELALATSQLKWNVTVFQRFVDVGAGATNA